MTLWLFFLISTIFREAFREALSTPLKYFRKECTLKKKIGFMKQIGQSLGTGVVQSSFYFGNILQIFHNKKMFQPLKDMFRENGSELSSLERGIQASPPVRSVSWTERIWSEETGISLPAASLFEVRRRAQRKGEPSRNWGSGSMRLSCWMRHSHGYWNYAG